MSKQYVFHFEDSYGISKNILGGKGAGLAEMTHIGVPIPQGFTISTEACNLYYDSGKKLPESIIEEIKAFAEETCKPLSEAELDSVNAAGGLATLLTDSIMDNIIKKDKSIGFCLVIGAGWGYGEGFGFTVCRIIGVGEGVSWEKMGSQKNK
jgi:phosphoenolpyruvate synthase/pyruvate phosphate dikinase